MKSLFFYETIIGLIGIAENGKEITDLFFEDVDNPEDFLLEETILIKETAKQLNDYLLGKRKVFELPIDQLSGTEFQRSVWKALRSIPYGETRSYKDIAEQIGNPKAARAVGMANNRNPLPILVPCHRVIGANGKLVGYGGGMDIKERLLNLEKNL